MDLKNIKPDIRELKDIEDVIFDKEWLLKNTANFELYYMYRDLAESQDDHNKIAENNLRYDITVISPIMLGIEFNKTFGHDHPIVPGTSITYPELYEVLEGEAIFLLQDSVDENIKDVFAIKAKSGDKIVIPPNYEHLIINASSSDLKTCNWICRSFGSNIYKPFRLRHGFCYYATKQDNEIKWIKNENYQNIPGLRFIEPNNFYALNLNKDKPIYDLTNDPQKLEFLKTPQEFDWK